MSSPGRENTLAAYVTGGGHLWAAGAGINLASLAAYYHSPTYSPSGPGAGSVFTSLNGTLLPGRFPYDLGGWRSEIRLANGIVAFGRNLGRFEGRGSSYDRLPATLLPKSPATDPLPPQRSNPGDFYQTQFAIEYLSMPNVVLSDSGQSDLDSLYGVTGPILQPPAVNPVNIAMTIYRPAQLPAVVWTGFSLWNFQRTQCQLLVDYVLRQEWGIQPSLRPGLRKNFP